MYHQVKPGNTCEKNFRQYRFLSYQLRWIDDVIDFHNNKMLMAAANMYAADQNDTLPGFGLRHRRRFQGICEKYSSSYPDQFDALSLFFKRADFYGKPSWYAPGDS